MTENKWKEEGTHINEFTTVSSGEKIIKVMILSELRKDLYLTAISKYGQIKRMPISNLDIAVKRRASKYMKLLAKDVVVDIALLSGQSDIMVVTNNGQCTLFNENDMSIVSCKAGGVKSVSGLKSNQIAGLMTFEPEEKSKIVLITNKGHMRVTDLNKFVRTARLGKVQAILQSFKGDPHNVVSVLKVGKQEELKLRLYLNDHSNIELVVNDFRNTEAQYAKKNIKGITQKQSVAFAFDGSVIVVDKNINSYPVTVKESPFEEDVSDVVNPSESKDEEEKKEEVNFEQISIFDDLD